MKKFLIPGIALVAVIGFVIIKKPLQGRLPAGQKADLSQWVAEARREVSSDVKSSATCESRLAPLYDQAYHLSFKDINMSDLEANAPAIAQAAFLGRLELREKLKVLESQGKVGDSCIAQIRAILRVYRYLEETLAVYYAKPAAYDENNVAPYLQGSEPYLRVNPKYAGVQFPRDLKSGDLLVSRGNAATSALISRLGDFDGQFSHLALVHVDNTGQAWVLEEHIEIGSTVRKFEEYAADHNFRVVVFRQSDATLAAAAAQAMFTSLSAANVPYDFGMVMDDERELFCSEVAYAGYKHASNSSFLLGRYPTTFSPKNTTLLDALAVQARSMFAPSDMELDTRFEILAEWKDISRVMDNQLKDATLTMYLRWMEDHGYTLDPGGSAKFQTGLGYFLRHAKWPPFTWIAGAMKVKKKFPLNMPKETLRTVLTFQQVAEAIFVELGERRDAHMKATGYPMTFKELFEELEEIRQEDLRRYNKEKDRPKGKPIFHKWFHAPEQK